MCVFLCRGNVCHMALERMTEGETKLHLLKHNNLEILTKPSMEDLKRSSSPIFALMEELCLNCNGKYCILYFPICIKSLIHFNDYYWIFCCAFLIVSSTPKKARGGRKGFSQEERDFRDLRSQGLKRSLFPKPPVEPNVLEETSSSFDSISLPEQSDHSVPSPAMGISSVIQESTSSFESIPPEQTDQSVRSPAISPVEESTSSLESIPPEHSDQSVPALGRQRSVSNASCFDDWDDSGGCISRQLEIFDPKFQRTNLVQDWSRSSTPVEMEPTRNFEDSMGKLCINNLNI